MKRKRAYVASSQHHDFDELHHGVKTLLELDTEHERISTAKAILRFINESTLAPVLRLQSSFLTSILYLEERGYQSNCENLPSEFTDFVIQARQFLNASNGKKGAGKPRVARLNPIRMELKRAFESPKGCGDTLKMTMRNWETSPPENLKIETIPSGGYRVSRYDQGDCKDFSIAAIKKVWGEVKHP